MRATHARLQLVSLLLTAASCLAAKLTTLHSDDLLLELEQFLPLVFGHLEALAERSWIGPRQVSILFHLSLVRLYLGYICGVARCNRPLLHCRCLKYLLASRLVFLSPSVACDSSFGLSNVVDLGEGRRCIGENIWRQGV